MLPSPSPVSGGVRSSEESFGPFRANTARSSRAGWLSGNAKMGSKPVDFTSNQRTVQNRTSLMRAAYQPVSGIAGAHAAFSLADPMCGCYSATSAPKVPRKPATRSPRQQDTPRRAGRQMSACLCRVLHGTVPTRRWSATLVTRQTEE